MEKTHLQLILTISCLCLLWLSGLASVPSRYSLGIDPKGTCLLAYKPFHLKFYEYLFDPFCCSSDESYYRPNVIKCKDGSKKFTREQLNDEFCDCPDGTDEPGLTFFTVFCFVKGFLLMGFVQNLIFIFPHIFWDRVLLCWFPCTCN